MDFDDLEKTFSSEVLKKVNFLNCFRSNTIDIEPHVEAKKEESTMEILQSGEKALKLCSNILDLTVVLHDHRLTPPFVSFLDSLWRADSIGPRLRILHLHMTLSKLPIFLKPLLNSPAILRNLEVFSIDFAPSRFDVPPDRGHHKYAARHSYRALAPLRSFAWSLKDSLTAISISTHNAHEFTTFLTGLPPHFPNLKKVELFTIFSLSACQIAPLFQFLSKHSNQLEELTIKPYPRQTSFKHSDDSYAAWISDSTPNRFGTLVFPKLKIFDAGLREPPKNRPGWTNPNPNAKPLPGLGILAPNLRKLVVTDLALSFERIDDLVSTLGPGLESIEFVTTVLSPQLFDLLASKVPSLEMLAVEYKAISDVRHNTENRNTSVSQTPSTYRLHVSRLDFSSLGPICRNDVHSTVSTLETQAPALQFYVFLWTAPSECFVNGEGG
jgi:hypothetical protein